jgi:hypothetical protein
VNWPFPGWGWDHWPELWSSAPSTAETAQEAAGPSPLEWASVSGQAPVKIVVPYSFTPADEAAEAVVLDELAVLAERELSPWAAADALFNKIGSGRDGTAGVAPGRDAPGDGPATPLPPPDADPLPV